MAACLIGANTLCINVGDSVLYVAGASKVVGPDAAIEGCLSEWLVPSSSAASSLSALAWSMVVAISSAASSMRMVSTSFSWLSHLFTQQEHKGRFLVIMVPTMQSSWHL